MSTIKLLAALSTATAVAGAAFPGWSQPSPDEDSQPATVAVRTGDLNLSTEAGARDAFFRIRNAAERICGHEPLQRDIGRYQLYRACVEDTARVAVASANQPMLAAVAGRYMHVNPTYLAAR